MQLRFLMICVCICFATGFLSYRYHRNSSSGKTLHGIPLERIRQRSAEQARGLTGATTIIHRAYEYKGPYPYDRDPDRKLVAVDAEFQVSRRGFDLDDVDLVDAGTNTNYGGSGEINPLDTAGELVKWSEKAAKESSRFLFIYSIPPSITTIKLNYWGQDLNVQAFTIGGDGPILPQEREKLAPK